MADTDEVTRLQARLDKVMIEAAAAREIRDSKIRKMLVRVDAAERAETRAKDILAVALESSPDERIYALLDEVVAKRELVKNQRYQISFHASENKAKNLALDALHYVWCSGGCQYGIHKYGEHPPVTREIVLAAIRNTRRMVSWFVNHERKEHGRHEEDLPRQLTGTNTLEGTLQMQAECDQLRDELDETRLVKIAEFGQLQTALEERDAARFELAKLRAQIAHEAMPRQTQILRAVCECGHPTGPGTTTCDALRTMPRGGR